MILQRSEAAGERNMLRLCDQLVAKEQHLVSEQSLVDGAKKVIVGDRFAKVDADDFGPDVRGELFDPHHTRKIDEPVVFPASRSRCA